MTDTINITILTIEDLVTEGCGLFKNILSSGQVFTIKNDDNFGKKKILDKFEASKCHIYKLTEYWYNSEFFDLSKISYGESIWNHGINTCDLKFLLISRKKGHYGGYIMVMLKYYDGKSLISHNIVYINRNRNMVTFLKKCRKYYNNSDLMLVEELNSGDFVYVNMFEASHLAIKDGSILVLCKNKHLRSLEEYSNIVNVLSR